MLHCGRQLCKESAVSNHLLRFAVMVNTHALTFQLFVLVRFVSGVLVSSRFHKAFLSPKVNSFGFRLRKPEVAHPIESARLAGVLR